MKATIGFGVNKNKVVVSLCDYSGNWPRPWMHVGYTVLQYDLKHGDDVLKLTPAEVWWHAWSALGFAVEGAADRDEPAVNIVMVMCAPPCTDFSGSGAQYWPAKDADGTTAHALAIVDACVSLATALSDAWVLENPVGRLWKLRPELGTPWYFQPHNYAGYCPQPTTDPSTWGIEEGLASCRYTKKTGLVGRFVRPPFTRDLPPVRYTKQGSWLQKLGGKSERTKELRSMTPAGFSLAFFLANAK